MTAIQRIFALNGDRKKLAENWYAKVIFIFSTSLKMAEKLEKQLALIRLKSPLGVSNNNLVSQGRQ